MIKCQVTLAEIDWILKALEHTIYHLKDEAQAYEGEGIGAIAETMLEGRQNLYDKLASLKNSEAKSIRIKR